MKYIYLSKANFNTLKVGRHYRVILHYAFMNKLVKSQVMLKFFFLLFLGCPEAYGVPRPGAVPGPGEVVPYAAAVATSDPLTHCAGDQTCILGISVVAQWLTNPTRNHKVAG